MQTHLRYKVVFKEKEVPLLDKISKKLELYLTTDFHVEKNKLENIDYPVGVKTYVIYVDSYSEMLELAIVEGSPSELHIHATKGKHSLPELVLSILLEEGGEITYNSLQEKSWLSSLFSK